MLSGIAKIYYRLDGHTREVVKGSASALVIRLFGAILSFALSVVLGRMLGANGVGLYFLAFSAVTIAAVIGRVGLDNALLRFTAASVSSDDWVAVKGLYLKSIRFTLIASSFMAILVAVFAPWISSVLFDDPNLSALLRLMALAIVPTALFTIIAKMLLGLKRTGDGIAILSVCAPALCLVGAIVLVPTWGVEGAAIAYAVSALLTGFIAWWKWHAALPQTAEVEGYFPSEKLLQSSVPLFWVALSQLVIMQSSTVILGIWSTIEDVGIYGAASRIVVLLSFLCLAVTSIASPKFSALYQKGDMQALNTLARSSSKLLFLAASPVLAILFFVPDKVMAIFGPEFVSGAMVIFILAAGQLVNIITGPAGNLLMMCGHERLVKNTLVISAFLCVFISLLLIPEMGVIGAAIANAVTVAIENLILATLVWRKLRIVTIPIPFVRAKQ